MKDKVNWKQTIITAMITVVVTVIAGMLLFYFQVSKPILSYSINQVDPFESKSEQLTIFHIKLYNTGKSVAENIRGYIEVKPAEIRDFKISSDSPLSILDSISNSNKLYIELSNLNSNESLNISLLLASKDFIPEQLKVVIRGKGVTAEEKNSGKLSIDEIPSSAVLLLGLLVVLLIIGISSLSSSIFKSDYTESLEKYKSILTENNKDEKPDGKHAGADQQHVFAYLFDLQGLHEMAGEYRNASHQITYWSASDSLTIQALEKDEAYRKKIINVLTNLIKYSEIKKESVSIVYYNISKLYRSLDHEDLGKEFLLKAKGVDKELIETRLEIEKVESF